jgi:hypothetical protein
MASCTTRLVTAQVQQVQDELDDRIFPSLGVVAMATSRNANRMVELYQWLHRHFPHFVDCRPIDLRGVLERARFPVVLEDALSIRELPVAVAVCVNTVSEQVKNGLNGSRDYWQWRHDGR